MSASETGYSTPHPDSATGMHHPLDEATLLDIGQALCSPVNNIVEQAQSLKACIQQRADYADFMADADKVLHASGQLCVLVEQFFAKHNVPEGYIDLDTNGSKIRHDLRTPINAVIGYGEMILEDIEESNDQDTITILQRMLALARRLLNLISEITHANNSGGISNAKIEGSAASPSPNTTTTIAAAPVSTSSSSEETAASNDEDLGLVDMGEDLQTPANSIAVHTQMLVKYAQQHTQFEDFVPDLFKMQKAAEQLSVLIAQLFDKHNTPDGKINHSVFTSTIRHDLRTPINAIIGYSEMLLEDIDTASEPQFTADLEKNLNSARKLLTLIGDLIYFAKPNEAGSKGSATEVESDPAATLPVTTTEEESSTLMDDVVRTMRTSTSHVDLATQEASLLVVDDKESNRDLLSRRLDRQGFQVNVAENGRQALDMLEKGYFDLVLLDIIMPEMNGYQVLALMKQHDRLKHLPVIMISALDEIDSVVRCIEMGAEDYLQKPFNQVILKAKISASLERKRLRDREHAFIKKLQIEREKSEKLLLNILPKPIADRLKTGARTIADSFSEVTVLFSDLVGFTELSTGISASDLVEQLNEIFLAFDILTELHGLEKIKTIGDAYMLVGGLPTPRDDHAEAVADMAIDMFEAIERLNKQNHTNFKIRVGIHTGPVVAGVIGKNKFNYDLWGDAVNVASRMESHGIPGGIQISEATYRLIFDKFVFKKRGPIEVKGKGEMVTYLLESRIS